MCFLIEKARFCVTALPRGTWLSEQRGLMVFYVHGNLWPAPMSICRMWHFQMSVSEVSVDISRQILIPWLSTHLLFEHLEWKHPCVFNTSQLH